MQNRIMQNRQNQEGDDIRINAFLMHDFYLYTSAKPVMIKRDLLSVKQVQGNLSDETNTEFIYWWWICQISVKRLL